MHETQHLDVAIIGGGWSGILACKYMTQNDLKSLAFEGSDDIGGVFKYRETVTDAGSVMKSTHTTSSKTTTEMSDYPMPHSFPSFPSHEQILNYLNNYVDHFNIRDKIILNTKIISVVKKNDVWVLEDSHGKHYQSKYLIVCSGVHQHPDMACLTDEKFKDATVKKMHAAAYKKITPEFEDKTILIYGGGETASDVSAELCHVAKQVFLSIPHGQWFLNRYKQQGEHMNDPFVLDSYSSELRWLLDPADQGFYAEYFAQKNGGFCGHGIEEWRSPAPYLGQFVNKSAHINHYLTLGSLIPKGEVTHVKGDLATFSDGTKAKIDIIIFCTGYKTIFPFIKDEKYIKPINERFKFVFDNDDPTLAFIGFTRPVIGSIPTIAEIQSMYAGKIFSQKLMLPNKETRNKIIENDKKYQHKQFSKTSCRISGLVNAGVYLDQLGDLAQVTPDYFKLLIKSPSKWIAAISAPYNSCRFHLNDESQHERIFDTFKNRTHSLILNERFQFVKILLFNLFPSLFIERKMTKGSKIASKCISLIDNLITTLLWIVFSPVILYRIISNRIKLRRATRGISE